MIPDHDELRPVTQRDYVEVETAVRAAVAHAASRRALLGRAGKALAVVGAGAVMGGAAPAFAANDVARGSGHADTVHAIKATLATFEVFGVTFVSEAVRRAPGTPSAAFLPVLRAANQAEYYHLRALQRIGAHPLATRIWIPEALFGAGGVGLFKSIERDEDIEISAYLVGVTTLARQRDAEGARLCAEALGTEAVHRALARDAQMTLGAHVGNAPNNRGFERFIYRTGGSALAALEALGVGFGKATAEPGAFYDFPGDPSENGTGAVLHSKRPR